MKFKNLFSLAALSLMAAATLTSCEDILGEWSRPTPAVVTPSAIAVTGITLNETEATINLGETKTLTATVAPDNATDKTVSWSTSDEAVATVTDGVVTAVAAGTAVITATANDGSGVKATCSVTVLPEGTLAGVFSVSATKKVQFSQGNLQAKIASFGSDVATASEWKFADNQYSRIGNEPGNTSFAVDTWVDLFCWVGESASNDTYGLITFVSNSQANHGNVAGESLKTDWGKLAISNGGNAANSGWRTLKSDEWTYLFNSRSASTVNGTENARFAKAKLFGTTYGVILFPDDYEHPADITTPLTGINATGNTSWSANQFTAAEWEKMESAGCVFLPAAGDRKGTSVNNANLRGNYWSSSDGSNAGAACRMLFFATGLNPASDGERYYGYSVRLVRDVTE